MAYRRGAARCRLLFHSPKSDEREWQFLIPTRKGPIPRLSRANPTQRPRLLMRKGFPPPLQHGRVLEKRTHDDGLHKLDGHQHHDGGKVQSA